MIKTVHFTLGEGAGKLLTDISREHLLYSFNPDKALNTITESLVGCPKNIALDLIKGDRVLTVDEDKTSFIVECYNPLIHTDFEKLDIDKWIKSKSDIILQDCKNWDKAIKDLKNLIIRNEGKFSITINYKNLIKFLYNGDIEDIIYDNDYVNILKNFVDSIKRFLKESYSIISVIDWLCNVYDCDNNTLLESKVRSITVKFTELMVDCEEVNSIIVANKTRLKELDKFLESETDNNEILKVALKPVNILDNYSAGWLSPTGEYYALNGDISNMLHSSIADNLFEFGIIIYDKEVFLSNSDSWLEKNGWVKIHNDRILYDGWSLSNYGGKNISMTEIQKDLIYKYGQVCCNGFLTLGYTFEKVTAARFNMTELPMIKKYFEI